MTFRTFIFFGFWGVLQAIPAPGTGALAGYCDTSDHCAHDECCVTFSQVRGRRVVLDHLDPNLMRFVHGSCQKRGTDGSKCFVNELQTGTDGLYYDCPCSTGYSCKGTGMREVPKGEIGTCVSSPMTKATINQPCASGADCADSECCVSDMRPIGKRQLHGHCSAMGTSGSGCLVRMGSGKPIGTTYACPCISGLTCHGNGMFDIPLGETGTCGV